MDINQLGENGNGVELDTHHTSESSLPEITPEDRIVGARVHEIRTRREMTLKNLSDRSKLNINTLSLIENGKTSPSIGTLQRLAKALNVPITAFFETEDVSTPVVFTSHEHRPMATAAETHVQNLGMNLKHSTLEPFVVVMPKNSGSGGRTLSHGGYEFAYCLSGQVLYRIEEVEYPMQAGDSVLFAAHLPHRWENTDDGESRLLLILTPAEIHPKPSGSHFSGDQA